MVDYRNETNFTLTLIAFAGIFWIFSLISYVFDVKLTAIAVLAEVVFIFAHCVKRYGIKNTLIFFGITFGISWFLETLSIATGFPFGNYYYTDVLGPRLGDVPWVIMGEYFCTGYLAWSISSTFLGNFSKTIPKKDLFLLPMVAGFIMVMWDFCFDPLFTNVKMTWVWEDGGNWWGVPLSNYFGWYLCVYVIYQVFAFYLYKTGGPEKMEVPKSFWYLPAVMYAGIALEYLVKPAFQTTYLDIYWSMFLAAIMTMVFTSILNLIIVNRSDLGKQVGNSKT